jgi:hypothetical protein
MEDYLGEFDIDLTNTMYAAFTPVDWAMHWIERYGQIDGDHHKAWVLDQIARILKGTPVIVKEARWGNGLTEFRPRLDEASDEYFTWVEEMKGEDGEECDYSIGVPP